MKELTEGMQRLCAIANRIVAHGEKVSSIERDLLLEDLRRLYDVALRLEAGGVENGERRMENGAELPDDEILSSTVMATMAAMRSEVGGLGSEVVPELEPMVVPEPEPVVVPEPEPEVVSEPEPEVVPEPVVENTPQSALSADSTPSLGEQPDTPAEEEEPVEAQPMPAMEELEGNNNSLLFDEVIIEKPEVAVESGERRVENRAEPVAVEPEPVHKAPGTQASLLDYLKRPVEEKPTVRTLGESLGEGRMKSEEWRVMNGAEKVSDLRTVININDKFSFMSELFHNNMKAYNDFILRLNAIDTRDEALMCVNEVSAQYHWDEGSLAVQSFYKVFDKKF